MGFDVLLTENLKPILLEINACPSLSLGHKPEIMEDGALEEANLENQEPEISVVDEAIKVDD